MASISKCKSCGWHTSPDKCQLLKIIVNPEEDFCSKHRKNIPTCEICGRPAHRNGILDSVSETFHLICESCYPRLGTCAICDNAQTCAFETDPSPLPKMVQQQIQQGPYQMVTTVRNPERVRITCQNGCVCFDPNSGCIKQNAQRCVNNKHTY